MSGVNVLAIEWRGNYFYPVPMASVYCPFVKDWNTKKIKHAWMGINHCNACGHVKKISLNYQTKTGEVHCGAPK